MKALFAIPPGLGHFLQLVPTAWALRAAGHDILVVASGPALTAAAGAGLGVADGGRDADIPAIFRDYMSRLHDDRPADPFTSANALFARVSDAMADATVDVARAWRPDLVVYSPSQGAGPLAAAVLGVPAVHHGIGLGYTIDEAAALRAAMTAYPRYGAGTKQSDAAVVELCPPSMRSGREMPGWPTRFVPYGGGGAVPQWLWQPGSRPRICLTLGSVAPRTSGLGPLPDMLAVLSKAPVEVVLALGGSDPSPLGPLPDNVRLIDWVPLGEVLPTCVAVIHHAGSGTTFHALATGVPQLALPQFGDQHRNAAVIQARGVGLMLDPFQLDRAEAAQAVARLLEDPVLRRAAEEVRDEMAAAPSPSSLPPLLAGLCL